MVLDTDEATGLFNPKLTKMRIAHNDLDHKFAKSIGARIKGALKQLPEHQCGIIALGDVPRRIADAAIEKRITDPRYDQVLAFVVCNGDDFHFSYRTPRRDLVQSMLSAGQRPLFTAA